MGNPESPWSCPVSLSLLRPWLYSFHLCALFLSVGSEHLCASLTFHGFVPRVLACLSHCPHLPLLSVCPAPCSICSPHILLTLASSAFCLCSVGLLLSLSASLCSSIASICSIHIPASSPLSLPSSFMSSFSSLPLTPSFLFFPSSLSYPTKVILWVALVNSNQ